MTTQPVFRDLEPAEMDAVLARNHVGRIAYSFHDRIDIEPIGYVYNHEWLYGRTSPGTKIRILEHRPWVAVEVDEAEGPFDWRSVVIQGSIHFPDPDGSEEEKTLYRKALEALRRAIPETLTGQDPVPFRTLIFAIHVASRSGRASSSRG